MASLSTIVKQILEQCGKRRVQPPVTDALAVFVVRMVGTSANENALQNG
jgi:hypothetical protein